MYTFGMGCCWDYCLHQATSNLHSCAAVCLFYLTYFPLMFSVKLFVYMLLSKGIEETSFTKWYDKSARFTTYTKYS